MVNLLRNWSEVLFTVLMFFGIILAILAPSAFIGYIIIFISGMLAGRVIYQRKGKIQYPYFFIMTGFLIGYLIGAYYGNIYVIALLFIVGGVLSHRLYEKGILKDVLY